jgi:hypothetical protein
MTEQQKPRMPWWAWWLIALLAIGALGPPILWFAFLAFTSDGSWMGW